MNDEITVINRFLLNGLHLLSLNQVILNFTVHTVLLLSVLHFTSNGVGSLSKGFIKYIAINIIARISKCFSLTNSCSQFVSLHGKKINAAVVPI